MESKIELKESEYWTYMFQMFQMNINVTLCQLDLFASQKMAKSGQKSVDTDFIILFTYDLKKLHFRQSKANQVLLHPVCMLS